MGRDGQSCSAHMILAHLGPFLPAEQGWRNEVSSGKLLPRELLKYLRGNIQPSMEDPHHDRVTTFGLPDGAPFFAATTLQYVCNSGSKRCSCMG